MGTTADRRAAGGAQGAAAATGPTAGCADHPPPAPKAAVSAGSGRVGRYAQAALQREATRVRAAPPGSCNDTLNRAAFNLGQLVAAGLLDHDQVRQVLLAAALAASATGHADRERKATATITSGLRGGAAKPRRRRDGAA
jgi:hypothetical protein